MKKYILLICMVLLAACTHNEERHLRLSTASSEFATKPPYQYRLAFASDSCYRADGMFFGSGFYIDIYFESPEEYFPIEDIHVISAEYYKIEHGTVAEHKEIALSLKIEGNAQNATVQIVIPERTLKYEGELPYYFEPNRRNGLDYEIGSVIDKNLTVRDFHIQTGLSFADSSFSDKAVNMVQLNCKEGYKIIVYLCGGAKDRLSEGIYSTIGDELTLLPCTCGYIASQNSFQPPFVISPEVDRSGNPFIYFIVDGYVKYYNSEFSFDLHSHGGSHFYTSDL